VRLDLALIVGSGFEQLGFEVLRRSPGKTPFGAPSSPVLTIAVGSRELLCMARHGETHAIAPHAVNYRANLWLLRQHGISRCIGINTVGVISGALEPGQLAVPDQLIDYTWGREHTFVGQSGRPLEHVEFTEPFDPALRAALAAAAMATGSVCVRGTYGVTQGPRLETAAEIARLERDGCAMVGMTAMPEAGLARELGMAYAICAAAVNWAAGHPQGGSIHTAFAAYRAQAMARVRACLECLIVDL
jgi:5'-methylthioinosine phosphorylase